MFLMVRDLEATLGTRLWTSGRGFGVAWTYFGTPGDVWGRFWGQPSYHLRRLGIHGRGLGDSFDAFGLSWRLHGARQQKR